MTQDRDARRRIIEVLEALASGGGDEAPANRDSYDLGLRECLVAMLSLFQIKPAGLPPERVDEEKSSQAQRALLRSLADYLREGKSFLSDWRRSGIKKGAVGTHDLTSGRQFVYLLEAVRCRRIEKPTPIRTNVNVRAIIKGRLRWRLRDMYLVQYDDESAEGEYQLLGGVVSDDDPDLETAIGRELVQELPACHLVFPKNCSVLKLGSLPKKESISGSVGALTEYESHFFQVDLDLPQLSLRPVDRWISYAELKNGKTRDGRRVINMGLEELESQLPNGLRNLPLSLGQRQNRTFIEAFKDQPLGRPFGLKHWRGAGGNFLYSVDLGERS